MGSEKLEILKKSLTNKQRRFCEEYVIDWNGTRSAIASGYSEKTAYSIAEENLRKPDIKAYIELIKNNLEYLCNISAAKNIKELTKIAYASQGEVRDGWMNLKDFEELSEDAKSCIQEVVSSRTIKDEDTTYEQVKIKLYSKLDALKTINQMMGYNAPEKVEVKKKNLTEDEIDEELRLLKLRMKSVDG